MSAADEVQPVSAEQAEALFRPFVHTSALVLAVSGGPDSTALLMLAARWRAALRKGPQLLAVTIDRTAPALVSMNCFAVDENRDVGDRVQPVSSAVGGDRAVERAFGFVK